MHIMLLILNYIKSAFISTESVKLHCSFIYHVVKLVSERSEHQKQRGSLLANAVRYKTKRKFVSERSEMQNKEEVCRRAKRDAKQRESLSASEVEQLTLTEDRLGSDPEKDPRATTLTINYSGLVRSEATLLLWVLVLMLSKAKQRVLNS